MFTAVLFTITKTWEQPKGPRTEEWIKKFPNTGFPGGSDCKESAYNAGDLGSILGWGRSPGGGHGNPLQYSCLENPHGQRSLVGYSLWGGKESDMTK